MTRFIELADYMGNELQGKSPKRFAFSKFDRLVFASLYRIASGIVNELGV